MKSENESASLGCHGDLLWKVSLGSQIINGPMTYEVDGRQYVAVISGHSLSAFALRASE